MRGHDPARARRLGGPRIETDAGTFGSSRDYLAGAGNRREELMHGIIYLVGLIVVILAILSFFGLR